MPALRLGSELVLRLGLDVGGGVVRTHARLLDRIRVGLGQCSEPPRSNRVRVGAPRVDLEATKGRGVRWDVGAYLSQPALLTDRHA